MKRLLTFLLVSVLLMGAILTIPTNASEGEELCNLYDNSESDYVSAYPFTNSYNSTLPLVLAGDDKTSPAKWSCEGSFISINNTDGATDAQYYVCGTNNAEYLKNHSDLIGYLDGKYVLDYEVIYKSDKGHTSLLVNYNYNYYIDAYVNPDGTGGIDAVIYKNNRTERISLMGEGGLLSSTDGTTLLSAIFGEGTSTLVGERIAVTLCVTPGENKLPASIELYLNGTKIATDNGKLPDMYATTLSDHVPQMPNDEADSMGDTFGYMCALNCTAGASSELRNVRAYKTNSAAANPDSVTKYAQIFGNLSTDPDSGASNNNGNGAGNGGAGEDTTSNDNLDPSDTETNENETNVEGTPSTPAKSPSIIPLVTIIAVFGGLAIVLVIYGLINIAITKKKK